MVKNYTVKLEGVSLASITIKSIGGESMIRIAICDDDVALCSQIESYLIKYGKKLVKRLNVEIFYSGESIVKYIKNVDKFDIIFLDIEMGAIDGVKVGEIIRNELKDETVQIIYISANDSYAMKLFETRPLNFLVKPIQQERLETVFVKACELAKEGEEYFTYGANQKTYRQRLKDIIYFESLEKRIRMVVNDKDIFFYARLKYVEAEVSKLGFLSIHKSYIVNPQHIVKYEYDQLTMSNGSILPVSQPKRSELRKILLEQRKGIRL